MGKRETDILAKIKDDETLTTATEAVAKGIPIDAQGVPQADPKAIRNFGIGDIVKFRDKVGTLLAFNEGFAVVTVDGEDWRVDAAELRDGAPGL